MSGDGFGYRELLCDGCGKNEELEYACVRCDKAFCTGCDSREFVVLDGEEETIALCRKCCFRLYSSMCDARDRKSKPDVKEGDDNKRKRGDCDWNECPCQQGKFTDCHSPTCLCRDNKKPELKEGCAL